MSLFKNGDIIETIEGNKIKIDKYLASGGQGDVYQVTYKGKSKALKWYKTFGNDSKSFYANLKANVLSGAPDKIFLWPEAITKVVNNSFGYVMDLRPQGFYELSEFIIGKNARFPSFKAAVETCLKIVSAFRILHNKGYSYQDINDGNFFINPQTADVLICDNDNVAPNGKNMGIIGKPRYMAPEIVIGKGKVLPNTQSDRFSLAVVLFILLCNNHPLEGKAWASIPCMTAELSEKIYGSNAVFIYDSNDKSNEPIKTIHRNVIARWKFMPSYIKDAFLKAFSQDAIKNPNKRLRELDWLKVLTRFKSEIVKCQCGNEIFIEDAKDTKCDNCGSVYHIKNKFKLPNYSITISKGTWVYRCQLGVCNDNEALNPVLHVVIQKSGDDFVYRIQNVTNLTLRALTPSGKQKAVQPNEVIPIISGIKIYAYDSEIEII